jgi:hypothetical protein
MSSIHNLGGHDYLCLHAGMGSLTVCGLRKPSSTPSRLCNCERMVKHLILSILSRWTDKNTFPNALRIVQNRAR